MSTQSVSSLYRNADQILKGQLAKKLRRMRAAGQTNDEIAFALRSEGVHISRETVRRWLSELEPRDAA